ncbi:MAG TPA: hypothetical protein VK651_06000 [Blastocatellia bacterium]|nr:hypothetical protein [Blastocatellia bacterium]
MSDIDGQAFMAERTGASESIRSATVGENQARWDASEMDGQVGEGNRRLSGSEGVNVHNV